jgi:exonuclease SbcD
MKKLRFIQTNDIHWRLNNPEGRTDVYYEAIGAKLFEIFEMARNLHADGILIAGDLFDSPGIGYVATRALGKILVNAPCPIFTIAGQHDEWDHNPESLRRTPYGIVDGFGAVKNVADDPVDLECGFADVIISGRDYDAEADVAEDYYEPNYDAFPEHVFRGSKDSVIIHLAHGTVLTETPIFEKFTLVSQLKTSADIVCVGDYHPGIGVQRIDNDKKTYVVNPGALARVKAAEVEMSRQVRVAVIEIGEDRSIDIQLVSLESARPGEKVLSREHIEIENQKESEFQEFLGLLDSEGDFKMQTDSELLEELGVRDNIPDEVKKDVLRRIALAEEEIAKRQVAA